MLRSRPTVIAVTRSEVREYRQRREDRARSHDKRKVPQLFPGEEARGSTRHIPSHAFPGPARRQITPSPRRQEAPSQEAPTDRRSEGSGASTSNHDQVSNRLAPALPTPSRAFTRLASLPSSPQLITMPPRRPPGQRAWNFNLTSPPTSQGQSNTTERQIGTPYDNSPLRVETQTHVEMDDVNIQTDHRRQADRGTVSVSSAKTVFFL